MQRIVFLLGLGLSMQEGQASPLITPEQQAAPVQTPGLTATPSIRLPAGAELEVELAEALSSKTSKLGQTFAIRLVAPIERDGIVVVAAGAAGQGEVIDAGPAGMVGRQGKLNISARHLDLNGQRVKVRGMTILAAGQGRVGLAQAVSMTPYVYPASLLVRGGNIEMPVGTRATVRLVEDVELPLANAATGGT